MRTGGLHNQIGMITMTTAVATHANSSTGLFARLFARLSGFATTVAAAHRVKIALEARRKPVDADLRILGIDPAQMPSLHGARI